MGRGALILLDTHVWIWSVDNPRLLSRAARAALRRARTTAVAAISCWEFAMLVRTGRIAVDRSPLEWMEAALQEPPVELLPLTPAVAARCQELGPAFGGDPADRLIVATALVHGASLLTKDERLRSSGAVTIVW